MNIFLFPLLRVACAAMTILMPVFDEEASGAAVTEALSTANSTGKNTVLSVDTKPSAVNADTIDAGYFKLQRESCLPLRPAEQTVMRIAGSNRQLSTADAATLSFSWRQIQHYRAETVSPSKAAQCYYFAP